MKKTSKKLNLLILINFILIALIGVLAISSASQHEADTIKLSAPFVKQLIWIILGMILIAVLSQIDYEIFRKLSWIFYFIIVLTLIFVLFKGGESRRWINLNMIKLQPSEFMKLPFIMVISAYISKRTVLSTQPSILEELKVLAVTGILTVIPVFLIIIEPDLGSSLIFPFILIAILYVADININILFVIIFLCFSVGLSLVFEILWLEEITDISPFIMRIILIIKEHLGMFLSLLLILLMVILISIIINFLGLKVNYAAIIFIWLIFAIGFILGNKMGGFIKPYQRARIMTFVKPGFDSKGSGWNVLQSKIAVGSGMTRGKGFLKGTQHRFRFLPERHTDFIFSVIGEEFGFIGSGILIILYISLIIQIFLIAYYANSVFGKLLASGILFLFLFHIIENIGMAVGMLPVTGLPLPLVSYGGSSFLVFSAAMGILLNISKQSSFAQG
ncbi:rod shape-determining protein RodA [Candidatus Dependentiae bacterium]|nr:rod shape-determining protein RodA [Candidatus Dependentiae bacterium]